MDNALTFDAAFLALALLGALIGAKRGLLKTLLGAAVTLVALIGSFAAAEQLTPPATEALYPKIEDALVTELTEAYEQRLTEHKDAQLPDELTELLDRLHLSAEIAEDLLNRAGEQAAKAGESVKADVERALRAAVQKTLRPAVQGGLHAVILALSFLVLNVVLRLAVRLLDLAAKLPVLHSFNALGGALLGLAEAAVILTLAAAVLYALGDAQRRAAIEATVLVSRALSLTSFYP